MARQVLSAAGLADDVGLLSTTAEGVSHQALMWRVQVKLVGSKTKLLVFTTRKTVLKSKVELAVNIILVDGEEIVPSSYATHVGVVRCPSSQRET